MTIPLLRTAQLTKQYGVVTVVDHVDLEIHSGEIHAILGANGAGKSTFCRMIAGLTPASQGSIQLNGKSVVFAGKQDAESLGIEIVQQELNLIPTLSIAENLFLSRLPHTLGVVRRRDLYLKAKDLLQKVSLGHLDPTILVSKLGVGQQQLVEIAKAIGRTCSCLILDEPTAALSTREANILFDQMHALKSQGVGIIYISHRLDEVKQVCDRLTILRDGRHVITSDTRDVSIDSMICLMSGTEPLEQRGSNPSDSFSSGVDQELDLSKPAPAIVVKDLSSGIVHDVSFSVRPGERLGITGLVGAGRTELLRAIFGADQPSKGSIFLESNAKPYRFSSPSQAVKHGLALITEDRKLSGLMLAHSVCDNTILASLWTRFSWRGLYRSAMARNCSRDLVVQLDTRCRDIDQSVGTLSGGNQQKVVLAKWLLRGANVYLFDEPTRGIDIAAKRKIHEVISELAQQGKGIIIVSSDIDELLTNCDRVAIMSLGRLVQIFPRNEFDRNKMMDAAFAGHRDKETRHDE